MDMLILTIWIHQSQINMYNMHYTCVLFILLYPLQYICKIYCSYISKYFTCTDINECANNSGGCSDGCVNTEGSYYCDCPSGYELSDDKKNCVGEWLTVNTVHTTAIRSTALISTLPLQIIMNVLIIMVAAVMDVSIM